MEDIQKVVCSKSDVFLHTKNENAKTFNIFDGIPTYTVLEF